MSLQTMPFSAYACPLCHAPKPSFFYQDTQAKRSYAHCQHCDLVFVPEQDHLNASDEKAIYDHHENDPNDQGYRRFLNKLLTPLKTRLCEGAEGLDFGSGPGPTLSVILKEEGYACANYDQFYANDTSLLEKQYDFVTSTEVVEHLRAPDAVFKQLFNCITPEGTLGLMTKLRPDQEAFARWHYINDPTHICFYSEKTMRYIAEQYSRALTIIAPDVIIFEAILVR